MLERAQQLHRLHCITQGTQSLYCHLACGASQDPNIWPRRVSPACRSGRAAGRGKSVFPPLLAAGERGSFFIQGSADRAFQLPLKPWLLCHQLETKGAQKESKLRLEGQALQQ